MYQEMLSGSPIDIKTLRLRQLGYDGHTALLPTGSCGRGWDGRLVTVNTAVQYTEQSSWITVIHWQIVRYWKIYSTVI